MPLVGVLGLDLVGLPAAWGSCPPPAVCPGVVPWGPDPREVLGWP